MDAPGEAVKQAIRSEELEALELQNLERLGVKLDEGIGSDGFTPMHWACHYGRAKVLCRFLQMGANVDLTTRQGWTGAHICTIRGCTECLQILWQSDVDLAARDSRGYTCAHLAAAHGKCSALKVLIKARVDFAVVDESKWSVVHHAAFHGRLGILQLLAEKSVDMQSVDRDGNSPAHLSAAEGHLDCLRLLVEQAKSGVREAITSRNNDGATPKDLAVQFQKQGCVNFLNSVERETDPGATQDTDTDGYSLSDLDFEEDSEEELAGSSLPGVGSPERRGRRALQEEAEQRKEMELRKQVESTEEELFLERERREELEAELDQLRKRLHLTTLQLHHCQALLERQTLSLGGSPHPPTDHTSTTHRSSTLPCTTRRSSTYTGTTHRSSTLPGTTRRSSSKSKRRTVSGGAFIRIGHV